MTIILISGYKIYILAIYIFYCKCYNLIGDKMIKCDLKQIHRVKHSIPIRIERHTHTNNELTYFVSGNGTTQINNETYRYNSGKFAFYKMGTPHNEINPEPCDIIWMHFSFDVPEVKLKEGVFDDRDGKLLSLLLKLRNLSFEQKNHIDLLLKICLAEAIVTAAEKQQENAISSERLDWKDVLDFIDTNINESVDFADLARKNHYSYDRFRHIFTEHFGLSPYAYLTKQRIIHAKRLLKNSDLPITTIAFDCGFSSSSQFTNIFKKHVGATPKEYRKSKAR